MPLCQDPRAWLLCGAATGHQIGVDALQDNRNLDFSPPFLPFFPEAISHSIMPRPALKPWAQENPSPTLTTDTKPPPQQEEKATPNMGKVKADLNILKEMIGSPFLESINILEATAEDLVIYRMRNADIFPITMRLQTANGPDSDLALAACHYLTIGYTIGLGMAISSMAAHLRPPDDGFEAMHNNFVEVVQLISDLSGDLEQVISPPWFAPLPSIDTVQNMLDSQSDALFHLAHDMREGEFNRAEDASAWSSPTFVCT